MPARDVDVRLNLVGGSKEGINTLKDQAAQADKATQHVNKLNKEMRSADPGRVSQVSKAYGEVAGQADRAHQAAKAANAEAARARAPGGATSPVGSAPRPPGGPPAAPGGSGLFSPANQDLAAGAAGAVAALQTLAKVAQTTATIIDAYADSTLTASQANRKALESVPLLGEFAKAMHSLSDAMTGRTEEIRKTQRDTAANAAKSQAQLGAFQSSAPINEQIFAINAQQSARNKFKPLDFNAPGRDSLQGERDFSDFERRRPLELARREAQIAAEAAKQTQGDASQRATDLQQQVAQRQRERVQAQATADQARRDAEAAQGGPGSPSSFLPKRTTDLRLPGALGGLLPTVKVGDIPGSGTAVDLLKQQSTNFQGSLPASQQLKDALSSQAKVDALLKDELKLRQQLTTTQQQQSNAVKASAEAESKLRQANIALLRDELQQLKERESRISSAATSFGGLDASQKHSAVQAAQQLKAHGIGSLTPDQQALIQAGGGGDVLNFERKKSALSDPQAKEFFGALGQEFDLKEVQKKQVELAAKVEVEVEVDTVQLSDSLKKALEPVLKELIQSFQEIADAQIAAIQIAQDIANLSQ